MAGTNATQELYRELAHRMNDGLEVALFWHRRTDELTVTVSDERVGTYFELAAQPHDALDVFAHPYAHAAFQGLAFQEASLASWAEDCDE
jgi:hypothetical protein